MMSENLIRLLEIMAQLRDPDTGCPWDVAQTFATIAPYTIEEAYEVADAIEKNDLPALKDELGDLLFQVVFHARMAQEKDHFDFDDVAESISGKMVRRHPHIFGDEAFRTPEAQRANWETQKAAERQEKANAEGGHAGILDGIPRALPALTRAEKLGKRAARVGFEWPEINGPLDKLAEEMDELRREIDADAPPARLTDEIGDVLFSVVNLARHLGVDPEAALRHGNSKFERRFRHVEAGLKTQDRDMSDASLNEMERWWDDAKKKEADL
jgi:nucleoside triphosphate diphosphatase